MPNRLNANTIALGSVVACGVSRRDSWGISCWLVITWFDIPPAANCCVMTCMQSLVILHYCTPAACMYWMNGMTTPTTTGSRPRSDWPVPGLRGAVSRVGFVVAIAARVRTWQEKTVVNRGHFDLIFREAHRKQIEIGQLLEPFCMPFISLF